MTFEYPWMLLSLLLAIPALLLWILSARRREARIRRFAEEQFADTLLVGNHRGYRRWHFLLVFIAVVLLCGAMSGPVLPGGKEKIKTSGIDIVVALDISNSMRANDIQPSRIERAKLALQDLVSTMGSDRLGLVVFAGTAYTNLPLTEDHPAALMVLESVDPSMISMQGTAIGDAIRQSTEAFDMEEKGRGKAIILISDGENHEDDAIAAAKAAAEKGIIVCAIGFGSTSGTKIPEYDAAGNVVGNKRDMNGNEVLTRLNESLLKDVAREGRGMYVHATSADVGLTGVYSSLQGLSKTTKEVWRYTSYIQLFPWLVGAALLLLLIEPVLPEGKRNERKQ
jgi:Ca-activated chloride channel family protein